MSDWSGRTKVLGVASLLVLGGCVEIDVLEPTDGQEYVGQPGETVTVTFRVYVNNKNTGTDPNVSIALSLDGEDYWDNVFFQGDYGPGEHWIEVTQEVDVTDQTETHWFSVFRQDGPYLDQVPFRVSPAS